MPAAGDLTELLTVEVETRARANLAERQENERGSLERDGEGPGATYLRDLRSEASDINDAFERIAVGGARDLEESLSRGAAKALGLKGAVGSIVGEFARLAVQKAFLMLFNGGGAGGGGLFGSVLSGLGSIFGGKREAGGPVDRGKAYLVGEKGPELFSPGISGAILSTAALRSAGGGSSFYFDLKGAVVTKDLLAQMNAIGQRSAVEGAQAGRALARQDLAKLQRPRM